MIEIPMNYIHTKWEMLFATRLIYIYLNTNVNKCLGKYVIIDA
jgi:hypothetical protein